MGRPAKILKQSEPYIVFFGDCDMALDKRTKTFKVTSAYPSWYFLNRIEMMKEEIQSLEATVKAKNEFMPTESNVEAVNRLHRLKQRLKEIEGARPKLNDEQKAVCSEIYLKYGKAISDMLFTRTDMEKGLANPHDILNRAKGFNFGQGSGLLSNDKEINILQELNCKIVSSKINGDDMIRVWKIIGRLLDEETNVERLRKDKRTGTFKPEKKFSELMKEIGED